MSELYREKHPLLCDDFSDEDFNSQNCSPRTNARMRSVIYSGRAKNQMKGAAEILTKWPEHWWSTLKYWWIGLGMIAIVVLIVYNSVVAFSMLPLTYNKVEKPRMFYKDFTSSLVKRTLFDINMHVFAETKEDVKLKDFIPYIEIISNRYQKLKFHLIIVINDTIDDISEETRNILALNSLWTDESLHFNNRIIQSNLAIRYVSINKYMNDPALQKFRSKRLSKEYIELLVRILSIWETGGIAFNPIILTPRSPNANYIEKIQNLLNNYNRYDGKNYAEVKDPKPQSSHIPTKKLNNIRDIINALEIEDKFNVSQYNLTEAEDNVSSVTVNTSNERQHLKNKSISNALNIHRTVNLHVVNKTKTKPLIYSEHFEKKNNGYHQSVTTTQTDLNNDTTKSSLLPIYFDILFPKKQKNISDDIIVAKDVEENNKINIFKKIFFNTHHKKGYHRTLDFNSKNSKRDLFSHFQTELDHGNDIRLSIDLRGNIIASNTPCHAFLGNLLSNAVHYTDGDTQTKFIITELTTFCKGVLFSCQGIDVILL